MNVERTLARLGVDGVVRGNELVAACPAHYDRTGKVDANPSWSISLTKGMHHCLGGETLVGTKNGRVPIRDLNGKKVELLTSDGWVASTVRDFGVQRLWDVVIQRNGVRKTIRATPEHRWFTRSKSLRVTYKTERTTRDLRPGHTLMSATPAPLEGLSMSPDGIRAGFIFGDGTRNKKTGKSLVVPHTVHKKNAVEELFPDGAYGYHLGWRSLPSLGESPEFLYGWLAGYFAADGCVDKNGLPKISSASKENLEFVKDVCWRLGLVTHGIVSQVRDAVVPGGRVYKDHELFSLALGRRSFPAEFYLLSHHRDRHRAGSYERLRWRVVEVIPREVEETVYCAEVPGLHEFVLDDYILTGNCFSCGYKGSLASLVEYLTGETLVEDLSERRAAMGEIIDSLGSIEDQMQRMGRSSRGLPENALKVFSRPPEGALLSRQVSAPACKNMEALWDGRSDSWVLVIRSATGALLGWQVKGTRTRDFRNFPTGVQKSRSLYGFAHAASSDFVVVVESPLDAVRLTTHRIPAVATYGASVSTEQIRLLSSQWQLVISAFDNDAAGKKATKTLINSPTALNLCVMPYTDDSKDPGEMPLRSLLHNIKTAPSAFTMDL